MGRLAINRKRLRFGLVVSHAALWLQCKMALFSHKRGHFQIH
jgi:hypothetical protein